MKVVLANDSFPPLIDGVVNVVINYANKIRENYGGETMVATPQYPGAVDDYPFEVVRYKSLNTENTIGYRTGMPFSMSNLRRFEEFDADIIHSHCPMASTVLARQIREVTGAPIILTYHTKFDIDIRRSVKHKLLHEPFINQMVKNIEACDEIWAVNRGAGENLKSLGYTGDYYVMKNGVDYDNNPAPDEDIKALNDEYALPTDGTPVFLFVGRMFWYKGARIILDSLREIKTMDKDFRMVFVGKGGDAEDMKKYAEELGIGDKCIFAGAIYDRKKLKAFYTRADLLFLPSTFDNDPLVVKEAASAHTASVLIKDSSSADDVIHMKNSILIEENYGSLTGALIKMYAAPEKMWELGENASRELYLSWDESIDRAMKRYDEVLRRCPKGGREHPKARYDKLIEFIADAYRLAEKVREKNGRVE